MMAGIDFEEIAQYQKSRNDPDLGKLISAARAAGDIPDNLYRPRLQGLCFYGDLYIGHPTVDMSSMDLPRQFIFWENVPYEWALHIDDNTGDMERAQVTLRASVEAEARFLKNTYPVSRARSSPISAITSARGTAGTRGENTSSPSTTP